MDVVRRISFSADWPRSFALDKPSFSFPNFFLAPLVDGLKVDEDGSDEGFSWGL